MSFVVTMRRTLPIRIFLAQVKMELSWKKNEIMKIVIMIMINKCHFNDCYKIQIYFIMLVGLLKLHIYNSHAGCALPYCWYFCQWGLDVQLINFCQWGLDVQLIIIIKKKKKKLNVGMFRALGPCVFTCAKHTPQVRGVTYILSASLRHNITGICPIFCYSV